MIPATFEGILYLDVLARLVRARDVQRYLEIGVNSGELLHRIQVDKAVGVDPMFRIDRNVATGKRELVLIQETSDRFFADKKRLAHLFSDPIEFSFLDGMHQFEYLLRDFFNAEAASSRQGLIVMHDCLALDGNMIHRSQGEAGLLTKAAGKHENWWTGDVWKIIPILRKYRPDLKLIFADAYPTGLVFVTNLNPSSTVLPDNYVDIAHEFAALPNTEAELTRMYTGTKIVSADEILRNQSQYFVS